MLKEKKRIKVAISLSGGVDSAVAAYLLKKRNKYDIIAIFMKNWDDLLNHEYNKKPNNHCNWKDDYKSAKYICKKLKIKLYFESFQNEYWKEIFVPFIEGLKHGKTPNPDILCNCNLKFNIFIDYVINKYNCNYLAFGHYARIKKTRYGNKLYCSKDRKKDQTYFLSQVSQEKFNKIKFPLWKYKKTNVYKIAKRNNLLIKNRKESTGLCFIGPKNFKLFLSNYLPIKKGKIIDYKTKKEIGIHDGLWFYTINQRKNLKINVSSSAKYFVFKKDLERNILYVLENNNPLMYTKIIFFENFFLINKNNEKKIKKLKILKIKTKHTSKFYKGKFDYHNKAFYLRKKIKIVASGQYGALYLGKECLGSGEFK